MKPTSLEDIKATLLPCPFCGGRAEKGEVTDEDDHNWGGRYVHCTKCDVSTRLWFPLKDSVEELIEEAWNQRAPKRKVKK